MDKLEYIPGDLVKFATNTYTIVNFEENFLHNKICYALISTNSTKTAFVADRDILPIPLTPEILEKNGWYGATHSKQSDDNTKILYKTFKRKGYPTIKVSQDLKITCELSPFIVKLKSVSDLQHLFFGLGLNSEMEV